MTMPISDTRIKNVQDLFSSCSKGWETTGECTSIGSSSQIGETIVLGKIHPRLATAASAQGSAIPSAISQGALDFLIYVDELVSAKQYLAVPFPGTQP